MNKNKQPKRTVNAEIFRRHIDINIDGYDRDAVVTLAAELEKAIQKLTDKWHGRREFKRILGLSHYTYATEGPWEHWRTEARRRVEKGQG
jgi:hypothetical protein